VRYRDRDGEQISMISRLSEPAETSRPAGPRDAAEAAASGARPDLATGAFAIRAWTSNLRGSLCPAYVEVDIADLSGISIPFTQALVEEMPLFQARVQVDGWDLLTLTPVRRVDPSAFDWSGVRVFVSEDHLSVALTTAHREFWKSWKATLYLLLPSDPQIRGVSCWRSPKVARDNDLGTPRPVELESCRPFKTFHVKGRQLIIPNFRGGSVHVQYQFRNLKRATINPGAKHRRPKR
jgi:hypothetical protein